MNHFGGFLIKPYETRWKGISCPKSERCSIQDLEVSCGSGHTFKSNHANTSSFHTQDMGLLCGFWLQERNGVEGVGSNILRMKSDVVPFWERILLGNLVLCNAKSLSWTLVFTCAKDRPPQSHPGWGR